MKTERDMFAEQQAWLDCHDFELFCVSPLWLVAFEMLFLTGES